MANACSAFFPSGGSRERETMRSFGVLVLSLVLGIGLLACLSGCGVMESLKNQETREKDIAIVGQAVSDIKTQLNSKEDLISKWTGVAALVGLAWKGIADNSKQNTQAQANATTAAKADAAHDAAKTAQAHVDSLPWKLEPPPSPAVA